MNFRPGILDIEASGFGTESYPIEVGFCLGDGERYCTLIKPTANWTHWDPGAEQLHNLSRELLMDVGQSPAQVAEQLNLRLEGQTLYSDAWVLDHIWLSQLFTTAQITPRFSLSAIEHIQSECQYFKWDSVKQALSQNFPNPRHRASVDAAFIQDVYVQSRSECEAAIERFA